MPQDTTSLAVSRALVRHVLNDLPEPRPPIILSGPQPRNTQRLLCRNTEYRVLRDEAFLSGARSTLVSPDSGIDPPVADHLYRDDERVECKLGSHSLLLPDRSGRPTKKPHEWAMAEAVAEAMGEAKAEVGGELVAGVGPEVRAEPPGFPETAGLAVDRAASPRASTPAGRRSGYRRPGNGSLRQALRE